MVCPQNLQTPIQVAFEAFVIPRVAFARQEDTVPIPLEHRSDHSLAWAVAARGVPVVDASVESRLKERVARIQVACIAIHECGAQPETENGNIRPSAAEPSSINLARLGIGAFA